MFDGVTCAIPGAKTAAQALENVRAASLPPLTSGVMRAVDGLYESRIRQHVHAVY
jgi:aryl-alcohol dehydrogenase-like predicted oxidoreductase